MFLVFLILDDCHLDKIIKVVQATTLARDMKLVHLKHISVKVKHRSINDFFYEKLFV